MQEDYLTAREVGERLGVTGQTVRKLVRAGRIPAILIPSGGEREIVRFRRSEVEQWIVERSVGRR